MKFLLSKFQIDINPQKQLSTFYNGVNLLPPSPPNLSVALILPGFHCFWNENDCNIFIPKRLCGI